MLINNIAATEKNYEKIKMLKELLEFPEMMEVKNKLAKQECIDFYAHVYFLKLYCELRLREILLKALDPKNIYEMNEKEIELLSLYLLYSNELQQPRNEQQNILLSENASGDFDNYEISLIKELNDSEFACGTKKKKLYL